MQINKRLVHVNRSMITNMNTKYIVIVTAVTAMLIAATALETDSAFADTKKGYKKTQATSQVNYCGNGDSTIFVFCQNQASQIQGEDNSVSTSGVQQGDDQ
jgi:hypothetical protein